MKNIIITGIFSLFIISCQTENLSTATQSGNAQSGANEIVVTRGESNSLTDRNIKLPLFTQRTSSDAWMGNLEQNTLLRNITVPGTHDSFAKTFVPLARTQSGTITEQLNSGIRLFDFRLNVYGNDLLAYHGPIYLGKKFTDGLDEINTFLKSHPYEAIFIICKSENGKDKPTWLQYYNRDLSKYESIVYRNLNENTTIEQVRGKIIPISRETYVGTTSEVRGWSGASKRSYIDLRYTNGGYSQGVVEDNYTVNSLLSVSIKPKIANVKDAINLAKQSGELHKWYIVGLNGTSAFAYPNAVADRVNQPIADYIKQTTNKLAGGNNRSGFILMDFANYPAGENLTDACIIQSIVANNVGFRR